MYCTNLFENIFDLESKHARIKQVKKICPKCNNSLELDAFNWKIKNVKKASYCKNCSRKYIKNHYNNNKKYYLEKATKRNKELKQQLQKYLFNFLSKSQCVDCGEKDILVLEFDHREKIKKSYNISHIHRNSMTLDKLTAEIKKCDVRCANCHRRKTEKEINSWKLQYLRQ